MRRRRLPPTRVVARLRAEKRLWYDKLFSEAVLLNQLGMLDEQGRTFCRECGLELERPSGWELRLVCACGWELHDL
jgi:hypothetical protein